MEARFPGHCEECEDRIRVGDEITATSDGRWSHGGCADSAQLDTPDNAVTACPQCWLTVCDCDVKVEAR